jgi:hypothetical protein
MKFRYRIDLNGLYIPEYTLTDSTGWVSFKVRNIAGKMRKVCRALGEVSAPRATKNGQWHFEPEGAAPYDNESVFFTDEIYVMAFIGAAQCWWSKPSTVEVANIVTK